MTPYDNLPNLLKSQKRFCCWRYEQRDGRKSKVPYNPMTRNRARSDDHSTFCDFATALAAAGNFDGIGFLVGGGVCAIDLDDCFDEKEILKSVAQDVADAFNGSYMERSPSGRGLRIIFQAHGFAYDNSKYYINNRKYGLEVYVAGATNRFVTLTGNIFRKGDVIDQTKALQTVLDKYMVRSASAQKPLPSLAGKSYLMDESVIAKASQSVHGDKFKALWQGNISGYSSPSEADLALCSTLAFFCSGDAAQMDRLFRKSGLYREKWDRPQSGSTYGILTMQKALTGMTEFYQPGGKRSSAAKDFSPKIIKLSDLHPENNERYSWTDIGASRLFADYFKAVARYVPERKMWFCYKHGIWNPDIGNLKAMELCKTLADEILRYALNIHDERLRTDYITYCRKWQQRHYRETVLKDAQSVYPISMAEFDQDPLVFNCANGTLFLKTMDFRPHNSTDRLTKISPVRYDPELRSERWEAFIWLVAGFKLLESDGLSQPAAVKSATDEYRHDSDKFALFFEDALEVSPNREVRTSEVYARYQQWCNANGCYAENARNFKQALSAIARVERKRPRSGGGLTTLLIGYKLATEDNISPL